MRVNANPQTRGTVPSLNGKKKKEFNVQKVQAFTRQTILPLLVLFIDRSINGSCTDTCTTDEYQRHC